MMQVALHCRRNCYHGMDLPSTSRWMLTQSAQWQQTDRHGVEPAPPNRTDQTCCMHILFYFILWMKFSISHIGCCETTSSREWKAFSLVTLCSFQCRCIPTPPYRWWLRRSIRYMCYVRFAVCAVVVCCMCMLFSYTLSFSRYNYLVVLVLVIHCYIYSFTVTFICSLFS